MEIAKLHSLFLNSQGVCTDTRNIHKESIYFALKGARFNGNDFALQALEQGASFAVVEDFTLEHPQLIQVKDVLKTLQELAAYHRRSLGIPIVAITGSNGKTTTKELIKTVLEKKYQLIATEGNFNNHIGVPLTLLRMHAKTELGIVEMGANHPGEIADLCEIAQPNWGYITNFGKAHLEGFGSLEGVIEAKSELYRYLIHHQGKIVVNAEDEIQLKKTKEAQTFRFGKQKDVDLQWVDRSEGLSIGFVCNGVAYHSPLYGLYNIHNILAAIALGHIFEVPLAAIQTAVASYVPSNNRSQVLQKEDVTLILDAYNANPSSMQHAIASFAQKASSKSIILLGAMLELGQHEEKEHKNLVEKCLKRNLGRLILVGSGFEKTARDTPLIEYYPNTETLLKNFIPPLEKPDYILIKGSRRWALERAITLFGFEV